MVYYAKTLPAVFASIFEGAFSPSGVTGGAVGSVILVITWGVKRGVFSNEAGLGSAPMAHASTSETDCVKQGLYGIFEVFMDTIVICTLTSLVVLCSGAATGNYGNDDLAGVPTAVAGFASVFGDKLGSLLEEWTSEGGWMNTVGTAISGFFTETLPEKWGEFWDGVGDFFSETVPYAIGYAAGKVTTFFTETLPEKWTSFWDGVGSFFTESIPAWWEGVKTKAATFFTETLPSKWTSFWSGVGEKISGFFGGI